MLNDLKMTRKKDMGTLRRRMDADDQFMSAHQIKKTRTRERVIPGWALNDKEVKKILLRAFPRLHTNTKVAKKAGNWVRVIHLYYRLQMPDSQVAKEMGKSRLFIKNLLNRIRRVANGRRADNTRLHGRK